MVESLSTSADDAGPRAELVDPARTVRFMLAGNAHVTFESRKSSRRFTYRVTLAERRPDDTRSCHFVAVLIGSDRYEYLGCIFDRRVYAHGRKSRVSQSALSAIVFTWVWSSLTGGTLHPELAVYHEGRCGACARRLTTPESISMGLGPTCAGRQR